MERSNLVKLIIDRDTNEKLQELALVTAKCWNEVNWLRMREFKEGKRVDFADTEKKVYEKYKVILRVNAGQVARKNAEAWRSFFELIQKRRKGELPGWVKPRPPGYWKEKDGKYRLVVIIRCDRYATNEATRTIHLKDFKLTLKFKGKLKWHGKPGRLEIIYDEAKKSWYAHIPVKVESDHKISGELKASADLGIVNLATVYIEGGSWLLFKGGSVLSQYEYYSKKIATVQKALARHKQKRSRRLKLLYEKRSGFLRHALNTMVGRVMGSLKEKGVGELVVGHPKGIARQRGNKLTVNFWNYGYVLRRLKEVGEELGVKVVEVDEAYTSKRCSLCGEVHGSGRIKRGLFVCPRMGEAVNADLNGAVNIKHIPESLGAGRRGQLPVGDRGNWLKAQPVVYRWTNKAGWPKATSYEVVKMKAVNHKPMIRPKGTLALQGGEEVR